MAVTLFDAAPTPPNRMAATLFHPRLLPDGSIGSRLRCMGYLYSTHWYEGIDRASRPVRRIAVHRSEHAAVAARIGGRRVRRRPVDWVIPVDSATASSLAGMPVRKHALFFPQARALDLGTLGNALMLAPRHRISSGYRRVHRRIKRCRSRDSHHG